MMRVIRVMDLTQGRGGNTNKIISTRVSTDTN